MLRINSTIWQPSRNTALTAILLAIAFLITLLANSFFIGLSFPRIGLIALLSFLISVALDYMSKRLRVAENYFARIARRRGLSILLVGLTSFAVSAGLSLFVRMPQPKIHDEFSYLLAGDTFANGRLTNRTHPMWIHFESIHIIQNPTYASKYPPAQGLVLAAGQIIGGHPVVGVWVSAAVACAALCWMMMAWLPPRWALIGGLLAVFHPIIVSWGQSYWGGAVAMAGGALVLGAFRRIVRRPRSRDALLMGLGMAVLANSRPYEGMVLSLLIVAALLIWMVGRNGPTIGVSLKRIVLPIVVVSAFTAGWMGFYNLRVTGNALRMPYMIHEATYAVVPPFLWQNPRPEPAYNHKVFQDFFVGWVLPSFTNQRSVAGFASGILIKILTLSIGCSWLLVPLASMAAMPAVLKNDWWMRFALSVSALFTVALMGVSWMHPHYAAPAAGLVFLLALQTMRHLSSRRWHGWPTWQFVSRATLVLVVVSFVSLCFYLSETDRNGWSYKRARILSELERSEGYHLVIVRYEPDHNASNEWVYNDADIDGAKVVWARDMGSMENKELLDYFRDRRMWLLEADAQMPKVVPYSTQ